MAAKRNDWKGRALAAEEALRWALPQVQYTIPFEVGYCPRERMKWEDQVRKVYIIAKLKV